MANEATTNSLDFSEIARILAQSRNRGGYERRVKVFNASDEVATGNIMDEIEFNGKDIKTVRNSLARNAKQFPHLKVLIDEDKGMVAMINFDLYTAQLAAEQADNESE